jgi:hypothetical protein
MPSKLIDVGVRDVAGDVVPATETATALAHNPHRLCLGLLAGHPGGSQGYFVVRAPFLHRKHDLLDPLELGLNELGQHAAFDRGAPQGEVERAPVEFGSALPLRLC